MKLISSQKCYSEQEGHLNSSDLRWIIFLCITETEIVKQNNLGQF